MKNVRLEVKGNVLTITVDLGADNGLSSSGKSVLIASTEGNVDVPDTVGGVKLGLNVYRPAASD